jgi:hypothetical protein
MNETVYDVKRRSARFGAGFTFPSPFILMSTNSQAIVSITISTDSRDTVEDNDNATPVVQGGPGGGLDRPLSPQGPRRPETY